MTKLSKIAKFESEMKRKMRDNELPLEFTWKTSKEVKNHGLTTDKKSTMKNN